MIVGIDGNEANVANRVGVNKYAFEIIRGIHQIVSQNDNPIEIIVYLKHKPLADMPRETANFKYKILSGGKIWIITKLMPYLLVNSDKIDVFFSPSHYSPLISRIPRVAAIMDLGYAEFSAQFKKYDFWQLKYWTAYSINTSKYILTISEATKKDIVRLYPKADKKTIVTYPGYDEELVSEKISEAKIKAVKSKYLIINKYILYLGTLKPSKNIEGLIEAWSKICDKYSEYQLVIAGKKGWLYESIFEKVKELGIENKVIFTDFIDESEKAPLIAGASMFVLPSFWEGFGLDVLTAFALKVPVLASNVGSLPEVVENAGFLVDPNNINSISNGIAKMLNMTKSERDKMILKGKMQLNKFSWKKASEKTLEILRKATQNG